MPSETTGHPERIVLVECQQTTISFAEEAFEIRACNDRVQITGSEGGRVTMEKKDQQVPYKAVILGSVVLAEESEGEIDYGRYFSVDWADDLAPPELVFSQPPTEIGRSYERGGRIELGIESVAGYRIDYSDGVTADFDRSGAGAFAFAFSTGFYGSFEELGDGSYTLTFKGDRLGPEEDELRSQSKFVISRSKYTGNLLLILQEAARVTLKK